MAPSAEGLWEHLKRPEEKPDDLSIYLKAALSKARAAGIPNYQRNSLYDFFIYTLAGMYYDARAVDLGGKERDVVNSFVLELRYAGEDDDEVQ